MNGKHQFLFRLVSAIDEELLEKATRERARLHEAKPSKKTPWRRITLIASAAAVLLCLLAVAAVILTGGLGGESYDIVSAEKTLSEGGVDTYILTLKDGRLATFTVKTDTETAISHSVNLPFLASTAARGKENAAVKNVVAKEGELYLELANGASVNLGNGVGVMTEGETDPLNVKGAELSGEDVALRLVNDKAVNLGALPAGELGISAAKINDGGELVLGFASGESVNLGRVVGKDGKDGVGIDGISLDGEGNLSVTLTNGTVLALGNVRGKDGIGIAESKINDEGELVITYTDGKTANLGRVVGRDGEDGVGISTISLEGGNLVITLTDGTVMDLGAIKGEDGKSAYELYCEKFGYEGTEEEWLYDLANGNLAAKRTFTVTFDPKGGAGTFPSQTVVEGGKATEPAAPVLDGYNFLGWFVGSEAWSFAGHSVTADITLEAKWEKKPDLFVIEGTRLIGLTDEGNREPVLVIPEGVTRMDRWALGTNAVSITLPSTLEEIDFVSFISMEYLVEIIDHSKNGIADEKFAAMLKSYEKTPLIHKGESIVKEEGGFLYTTEGGETRLVGVTDAIGTDLRTLTLPDTLGGERYTVASYALKYIFSVKTLVIPDGVERLEVYAVLDCSFETVKIAAGVSVIEEGAFTGCMCVMAYEVDGANPAYKSADDSLYTKDGTVLLAGATGKNKLTVQEGTLHIGLNACRSAQGIEEILLPEGLLTVAEGGLRIGNMRLTSLTLPDSLTGFGSYAFPHSLTSITLPAGVTEIPDHAFDSYFDLAEIRILGELTHVGIYAFGGTPFADHMENYVDGCLYVGNVLVSVDNDAYSITVREGTVAIAGGTFQNSRIQSLILPDSLVSISLDAFRNCDSLTELHLPRGLVELDEGALQSLTALERITVAEENPAFRSIDGVLYSKDGKTLVCYPAARSGDAYTVEAGVTHLAPRAFAEVAHLRTVTLPDGLLEIGWGAFQSSNSLTSVTVPASVTAVGDSVFSNSPALTLYFEADGPSPDWSLFWDYASTGNAVFGS